MKHFKVIIAVLILVIFGCNKKATSQESVVAPVVTGIVVIEAGTVKITDTEIKEEMANLPPQLKAFVSTKDGKKEFVESLAKRELLYQEAKAKGLDNNEKVKKDLEAIKKRMMVDAFLRDSLKADKPSVDDKTLKEYFKKNEKEFMEPEKTHSKHILVKDKKLADELSAKLKKDPSQFEKFAMDNSVDSSGKMGGDLGPREKGTLIPEFEAALDKLKAPGDISPVVKSNYGFHVIKLVSREKGKLPQFEKIREEIREAYLKENQKVAFDKLMEELKKKYLVKINQELIEKLGDEPKK
jgi:peptidyl-prolyl cis-trans isomerase C